MIVLGDATRRGGAAVASLPPPLVDLPRVIGHRGVAAHAPENTHAGFACAAALGVRWVEFDAKITADGYCIAFHDQRLQRTTDGRGRVAGTSYEEIRRLDAGAWFAPRFAGERVPRLEDVLAQLLALDVQPNIEIKPCPGRYIETARSVVAVVAACWPKHRAAPLITSRKEACVATAQSMAPSWPRGMVWRRLPRDWRRRLEALGCAAMVCHHKVLNRRRVREATAAGLTTLAFTVNEASGAEELLDWGVDAVISDAPDVVLGPS